MSMQRHPLPGVPFIATDSVSGRGASALTHEQRAAVHYSRGEKDKALELYKEAAHRSPGDVAVQKALADFTYVALGRPDDALPLYKRVLELKPNDTDTLQILGNLFASRQMVEEARQYFHRLLSVEPWNMAARKSLEALPKSGTQEGSMKAVIISAQQSIHSGEDERVNAAIDRIVQMKESAARLSEAARPLPPYAEIQKMVSSGQHQQAIAALEQVVARTPGNALAHNDLGVLFAQGGDFGKALEHYRRAVDLDPAVIVYQKNLADLLFAAGDDAEGALRTYVAILRTNPKDTETLGAIAQVCASLGRVDDALYFYDRILELEPWNQATRNQRGALADSQTVQASYELAQRLAAEGKIVEARTTLEEFVRSSPAHAAAHNDLGVLYYQTGSAELAQAQYEEAVRLDPGNFTYLKNLAEYYSVAQGRNEDALRIFVEILRKQPRDVETLVSIGKVCEMLGRADDAQDFFRKALEVEPWNTIARDQLQRVSS